MRHLTHDEIERLAETAAGPDAPREAVAHLETCTRCREEVEMMRTLFARIASLPSPAPSASFSDAVMRRVELPTPWLDRQLERLPRLAPSPGFAAAVLARVRLPLPWHERLWRFAHRRRAALASAAAATLAVSGAGAAWLFGAQGVSPSQFIGFLLGGARDLAIRGLMEVGQVAYRLGLVDTGSWVADRISPLTAAGSLALASLLGLLALWTMARIGRAAPERPALAKAA